MDGQFVGLLVKNLENIQGDERDLVILSVCYGPGSNGRMLMNFGPINKSGGEKRLNVAFSRAKKHMAVVSSIQYSAITNDYNDGAACLKNYLRYAESLSKGDAEGARRVLSGISRWRELHNNDARDDHDYVSHQLAAALRKRGYVVDHNVGHSHFRVDLAIRRNEDNNYSLGILIDAPAKYEHTDALEREMMRPRLLRSFGWRLAHVLAKDWYSDRDQSLTRVLSLVERKEEEWDSDEVDDDEDEAADDTNLEIAHCKPDPSSNADEKRQDLLDLNAVDESASEDRVALATTVPDAGSAVSEAANSECGIGIRRYFEFRNEKSSKFWEISLRSAQHTVRFGRIGSSGQSQTKSFTDDSAAQLDAARLIQEKTRKGYYEVG